VRFVLVHALDSPPRFQMSFNFQRCHGAGEARPVPPLYEEYNHAR